MERKDKMQCPSCRFEVETVLGRTFEDIYWMLKYFNKHRIEINPKKERKSTTVGGVDDEN